MCRLWLRLMLLGYRSLVCQPYHKSTRSIIAQHHTLHSTHNSCFYHSHWLKSWLFTFFFFFFFFPLVGGAYAFAHYAGIDRHTKDFDIFVRKEDAAKILDILGKTLNCKVDRTFHWLFKAILGVNFIDIIFR
jgi:hypothetical protein